MKKVLITTSSFGKEDPTPLQLLRKRGVEYVLNPHQRKITEDELISLLERHKPDFIIAGLESITHRSLTVMKDFVRVISRCGIGLDNVDLASAKELGIAVKNTPLAPVDAVAELTLGLMLNLLRKISYIDRAIRKGEFPKVMGELLHGKTVGIIGCGRIGTAVCKILQPFQCKIVGYDAFLNYHPNISLLTLQDVLQQSDIVTLHINYSESNKNIINAQSLSSMKQSAYLINTSRGGLIDEIALYKALQDGKIAGAGIDCFETEPYTGNLQQVENIILTSHIGSYAKEARLQQEIESVKNLFEA